MRSIATLQSQGAAGGRLCCKGSELPPTRPELQALARSLKISFAHDMVTDRITCLPQGKRKLRPIDDFSENKVNLAFGCSDKLDLFALDEIVGVCRVWTAAFLGTGELCWPLSTGEVLEGTVHPAWRAKEGWRPKLTTLDLHQA